jgi:hypothetical protein
MTKKLKMSEIKVKEEKEEILQNFQCEITQIQEL